MDSAIEFSEPFAKESLIFRPNRIAILPEGARRKRAGLSPVNLVERGVNFHLFLFHLHSVQKILSRERAEEMRMLFGHFLRLAEVLIEGAAGFHERVCAPAMAAISAPREAGGLVASQLVIE